jgi:nicotinate-nucleotide pyrophosphorylase (carboxylating)
MTSDQRSTDVGESAFPLTSPHPLTYEHLLRTAFEEDLGRAGDLTTEAVVPPDARAEGTIGARRAGVLAGVEVAARAFALYDSSVAFRVLRSDGMAVEPGDLVAEVSGPARSLLTAERTALNLLGRLSGIASQTASVVEAVRGTGAAVVCTRKTTPGLRSLEKYAVRAGGGSNHRFGLDDAVLVKDNHLAIAGSVAEAVRRVRARVGHLVKVEVEVDNLDQLDELLKVGADAVLLDNLGRELLAEAVGRVDGRMITEASGGIIPEGARAIAASGVDLLSIGWLTHSARSLDVGLDL